MTLKDTAVPTIFLKSPDTSCKRGRRRGRSDYRRLVNEKQKVGCLAALHIFILINLYF